MNPKKIEKVLESISVKVMPQVLYARILVDTKRKQET
jgi:hypothetical protein